MSAPPKSRREWLGDKNAYQKAVWTVLVQQQMKDYADFLEKLRVEWHDFDTELEEAWEHGTATAHIPNSAAGRAPTTLLGKMRVCARQRYEQLEAMWDNTQRYTELMYRLFGETVNWPTEDIDSLGADVAVHLEAYRGHPDDDDEGGEPWIRQ